MSAKPSARVLLVPAKRSPKLRGVLSVSVFAARIPTIEIAVALFAFVVTSGVGVSVEVAPATPCRTVAVARLGAGEALGRRYAVTQPLEPLPFVLTVRATEVSAAATFHQTVNRICEGELVAWSARSVHPAGAVMF